ncbi:MAG TPA: hypothetical protein VK763_20730 [Terriglobales bacterium]|nr:hypothetical protein [Terriglobales bacterium]
MKNTLFLLLLLRCACMAQITTVAAGTGISVTNPTGPTVTVSLASTISPQFISIISSYVSQYAGADGCAQINAATTDAASKHQNNVIVDLSGDIGCAANPIASAFSGNLYFGSAVFHLKSSSAQWVIPAGVQLFGMGRGVVPAAADNGTVIQACNGEALPNPCAGATFTSNSQLVCIQSCTPAASGTIVFFTNMEEFYIDCNNVPRCIGFANYWGQEGSGIWFSEIVRWGNDGIGLDHGAGQNNAQNASYNHLSFDNATGAANCDKFAVGMRIWGAGPKSVRDITISGNSGCAHTSDPNDDMEVLSGGPTTFDSDHFEEWQQAAINVGAVMCYNTSMPGCGSATSPPSLVGGVSRYLVLSNVEGSGDTEATGDFIRLSNGVQTGGGTASSSSITIIGASILNTAPPVNLINDQANLAIPTTLTTSVPKYTTNSDGSVYEDSTGVNIEVHKGYVRTAAIASLTANVSMTNTAFAPITSGSCSSVPITANSLCFVLPASSHRYSGFCEIYYDQGTAPAADQIGVQMVLAAPTLQNVWGWAQTVLSTAPTVWGQFLTAGNDTLTHSVLTFTPGASATVYQAHLAFTIENSANTNIWSIVALTGNTNDALVFGRGSFCKAEPDLT